MIIKPSSEAEIAQAKMSVAPIVILEVVLVAIVTFVVRDAPEVSAVKDLKIQDPGLKFILNDIYRETGNEEFVKECYNTIITP